MHRRGSDTPSFRLHELVSAAALSLAALGAHGDPHAWLLRLAAVTGLMHHHGMGKPYLTIQDYVKDYKRWKPAGVGLNQATQAALEWLKGHAARILPPRIAETVERAAYGATKAALLLNPAAELDVTLREARKHRPIMTAYTVAVAATAAADTLIAQLKRNNWEPGVLEANRWANRLLREKTRPGTVKEKLLAIRRECGYP